MNRLILAALPLLMLALPAGAGASIRTDGFARTASEVSDAGAGVELSQHEETYGDDNYYGDEGYEEEYTDEYGDALPEDQADEDEYADDEYADDEGYEEEYTDEQGYEEEYTDEQGYEEEDEYDDATQDDYY